MDGYSVGQSVVTNKPVPTAATPGGQAYGSITSSTPSKILGFKTVGGKNYVNVDQSGVGGGTGWAEWYAPVYSGYSQPAPAQAAAPAPAQAATQTAAPRQDFVSNLWNSFAPQEQAGQQKVNSAQQQLMDYYKSLQSPVDLYNNISQQQGLGDQQNLVNGLTTNIMDVQKNLQDLEPSVNQRSGDFLMNDAQRTAVLARERYPLEQTLSNLLQSKDRQDVTLNSKQALVSQLLDLSLKNYDQQAKPLQLNVDYTTNDLKNAEALFQTMSGQKISAFNNDQDAADKEKQLQEQEAFSKQQQLDSFTEQEKLKGIDLSNSEALAAYNKSISKSSNSSGGAYNNTTSAALDTVQKLATTSNNPQSAVWSYIHALEPNAKAQSIDTSPLWNVYNALGAQNAGKAKTKTYTINGKTYTVAQ